MEQNTHTKKTQRKIKKLNVGSLKNKNNENPVARFMREREKNNNQEIINIKKGKSYRGYRQ